MYVSCGAPTLARDAKLLTQGGYRADKVQCVDMFCWTGAVETVVQFTLNSSLPKTEITMQPDEHGLYKPEEHATYGNTKEYGNEE